MKKVILLFLLISGCSLSKGIEITLESPDEDNDTKVEIKFNNDQTGSIDITTDESRATLTYVLEEIDSIPEVDISNSAPFAEMTEEEKEALENFINMFNPIKLVDIVNQNTEIGNDKPLIDCTVSEDGTINCGGLEM